MKKLLLSLFIAVGFFSCSQDQSIDANFTSQEVQSKDAQARDRQKFYTLAYKIQPSNFEAGSMATDGNILAVANTEPGSYSIKMYSIENGNSLYSIQTWTHKDSTITLHHAPSSVCIYDGRIYLAVAEEGKVYVFDTSSFGFVTTIGNGNMDIDKPSDDKFAVGAPCTVVGYDGKLLIRDRKHIRFYNVADITPENYEAVPYYAAGKESNPIQPGTSLNQGYITTYGYAFLTDADTKQVILSEFFEDIQAGDEVTTVSEKKSFSSAPSGVAISEDRAYLSFGAGGIKEYTPTGFRLIQNITVKDNPLPEVKSLATARVENQPVLFIATPKEIWMVWVAPFERMLVEE